jgi:hypothetical protein
METIGMSSTFLAASLLFMPPEASLQPHLPFCGQHSAASMNSTQTDTMSALMGVQKAQFILITNRLTHLMKKLYAYFFYSWKKNSSNHEKHIPLV